MRTDYLSENFTQAAPHRRDGMAVSLGASARAWLGWSLIGGACTTLIALSPDFRAVLSMLLKVAWLYMVAGARG
jgi:hypothetical protein